MNTDQIEGKVRKVAGKVEEKVGELVGDTGARAEGIANQVAGAAQDAYGQARDQVQDMACGVSRKVEENPMVAVLLAGAVGYLLGMLSRPRD